MNPDQETQIEDFYHKLDQWISKQGIMFQLFKARGMGSPLTKIFGLIVRLVILLLLVAIVFWLILVNRPHSDGYRHNIEAQIQSNLGASKVTLENVGREKGGFLNGKLGIGSINIESSENTFFEDWYEKSLTSHGNDEDMLIGKTKSLSAEGVFVSPLGIGDGIYSKWSGRTININRLTCKLKTGAETDEIAQNAYQSLFHNYDELSVKDIEIDDANLLWGYGDVSRGEIKGAKIIATRDGDRWDLEISGGQFSHGWLKNASLIKMSATCYKSNKVVIHSALLNIGGGELKFKAKIMIQAEPEVTGEYNFKGVDVLAFIGQGYERWLDGSIGGNGVISGKLNTSMGLKTATTVNLVNPNATEQDDNSSEKKKTAERLAAKLEKSILVMRSEFSFLRTMRNVDFGHNYKHLIFDRGSFDIIQQGGDTRVENAEIRAGNLMIVKGAFSYAWNEYVEKTDKDPSLEDNAAAESSRQPGKLVKDDAKKNMQLIKTFKGKLMVGLLPSVFEHHQGILKQYPVDDASQRVWLPLEMRGSIKEVSSELTSALENAMKDEVKSR